MARSVQPNKIKKIVRERAREMYFQLLEQKLEVVLIPAREQRHANHCIRVAVNRPPQWFSNVAQRCMRISGRQRKARPRLSRKSTLRALELLSEGQVTTDYAERWLKEIERLLANELAEVPF